MLITVPDQSSVRRAAVGFYGISKNVTGDPSADAQPRVDTPPVDLDSPAAAAEERQPYTPQTETEPTCAPQVVCVDPGPDTQALIAAEQPIAIGSGSGFPGLCGVGGGLEKVEAFGTLDLAKYSRIGDRRSEKLQDTQECHVKGSCFNKPEPASQRDGIERAQEDPVVDGENWSRMLSWSRASEVFKNTLNTLNSAQMYQSLEAKAQKLTRENKRQQQEIELQNRTIDMLREHGNQMERRYKDAEARFREANASAAELKNDIARLCNAVPDLTDDLHFNTKFSGIFLSLESWVLQHFMHAKINSSDLQLLPTELREGLSATWGERWGDFVMEETLHSIEAVAILVIRDMMFETRMLGILGELFPAIEEHFGSCSMETINAWRMQTTRMIVEDKGFPSRVERRVCEVADHIEKLLGNLAGGPPTRALARMRRLKAIVGQAAELAVACNKEPSAIHLHNYSPGCECQSSYMTDAHRTVDDEHLGANGACVMFTVSPAVLRTPRDANGEAVVITKARVVRHMHSHGSLGGEEGSQTQGDITYRSPIGSSI